MERVVLEVCRIGAGMRRAMLIILGQEQEGCHRAAVAHDDLSRDWARVGLSRGYTLKYKVR